MKTKIVIYCSGYGNNLHQQTIKITPNLNRVINKPTCLYLTSLDSIFKFYT
ncbi:hypothetical protein HanRHA438_Chr14g0640921 [Helianthus annuus]|nr:hypothetical protein HanRHA438_Chr14g0640921 [Helianthus annuus]